MGENSKTATAMEIRRNGMTIGMLAKAVGVGVETVRYYQRIGLMSTPARGHGSVRRYTAEGVERVRFIKRAQQLGFTLEEVAHLLRLEDGTNCNEARELATHKLMAVEQKLSDLHAMRDVLADLIAACGSRRGAKQSCPLIERLLLTPPAA
jgi:MerR family mercuric resistance operon transcriptional regulator